MDTNCVMNKSGHRESFIARGCNPSMPPNEFFRFYFLLHSCLENVIISALT